MSFDFYFPGSLPFLGLHFITIQITCSPPIPSGPSRGRLGRHPPRRNQSRRSHQCTSQQVRSNFALVLDLPLEFASYFAPSLHLQTQFHSFVLACDFPDFNSVPAKTIHSPPFISDEAGAFITLDLSRLTSVVGLRSSILRGCPLELYYSRDPMPTALLQGSWTPYAVDSMLAVAEPVGAGNW